MRGHDVEEMQCRSCWVCSLGLAKVELEEVKPYLEIPTGIPGTNTSVFCNHKRECSKCRFGSKKDSTCLVYMRP